jgi:hypothetical protein
VTALYTALGLGILLSLFVLAYGANRVEQLERRRTALQQDIEFERDQYRRMLAQWLNATARERVVPRAREELQLVEARAKDRILLVLPEAPPARRGLPPVIEQIARGFDRYGEISSANAGERP